MALNFSGDGYITGLTEGWSPDRTITVADLTTGAPAWDIGGNLAVGGNLTLPGRITASGAASFGQGLTVGGAGSIGGNLTITGDLVINGTLRSQNAITAGGVIQIRTAVAGPNRQLINSAVPQPVSGLAINFTPAVATSRILIQAFVSTSATYVTSFGIFKDGQPTVSTSGFTNQTFPNMQVTRYGDAGTGSPEYMHNIPVTHTEPALTTATRTYQVYGLSRWYSTTFNLWINNRNSNDMAAFSHMIIYEIAQ
jgi:hypothetical protein